MITRLPLRVLSNPPIPGLTGVSVRCARIPDVPARRRVQQTQSQRLYSTPPPPTTPKSDSPIPADLRSQFTPLPTQQPLPEPKKKLSLRPYIYATFFLLLGVAAGQYPRLIIAPPELPAPGSKEDRFMVEHLTKQAEKLPVVQSLSADPKWTSYDAYSTLTEDERLNRLTTGPLGGARALGGFQRIFYNEESGEIVAVIWFGGAISGWPGVTHGGVVATVMDEVLGRCAVRQFPAKTGVTANLELNYLKPVITNSFYVIRAVPVRKGYTERKGWVQGRVEDLEGSVYVEGKGLFVVPKTFKTKEIAAEF